jgi:hypothetical protein
MDDNRIGMECKRARGPNGFGQLEAPSRVQAGCTLGDGGCQIDDTPAFKDRAIALGNGFAALA